MFFKRVKVAPISPVLTPAEQKLEEIRKILFPPLKKSVDREGNTYHIDYSALANLDAALMDLEEGHNDLPVQHTVRSVANSLEKVQHILEAYYQLDEDAKFLIVDTIDDIDLEKIVPGDEKSDLTD